MGAKQVQPQRFRVDLGVIPMYMYSTLPKALELLPHNQMVDTWWWGDQCKNELGVFNFPADWARKSARVKSGLLGGWAKDDRPCAVISCSVIKMNVILIKITLLSLLFFHQNIPKLNSTTTVPLQNQDVVATNGWLHSLQYSKAK